jgi:hypothetical protein
MLTTPPTVGRIAAGIPGGSEVWMIAPDGEPTQIWSHPQALVYTLALDAELRPVAGTGNEGQIHRIDSPTESTRLATAEPMQVTALVRNPRGGLFATTANPAKIFRLGPELEKQGSIESELLDAGSFTYWGRLRWTGEARGGGIRVEARSGNLDRARRTGAPGPPSIPRRAAAFRLRPRAFSAGGPLSALPPTALPPNSRSSKPRIRPRTSPPRSSASKSRPPTIASPPRRPLAARPRPSRSARSVNPGAPDRQSPPSSPPAPSPSPMRRAPSARAGRPPTPTATRSSTKPNSAARAKANGNCCARKWARTA